MGSGKFTVTETNLNNTPPPTLSEIANTFRSPPQITQISLSNNIISEKSLSMIYHIQTASTETGTNAKYQMQRKHSQKSYGEFLAVLLMVFIRDQHI